MRQLPLLIRTLRRIPQRIEELDPDVGATEVFEYVKQGGAYAAPLLFLALLWMNSERQRLRDDLAEANSKLELLADRAITVMAELKTFLFSERRS